MSGQVSCIRCKANVPVSETTFTAHGDYLCRACSANAELAVQVERARQEGVRKADGNRGLLSWFLARRAAKKEHEAMVAGMPTVGKPAAGCATCGGPVPRGKTMCKRCAASAG